MPFRFRRIISLGKGFRINLSKSGISSSIGSKGFTVNIGKRGVRPTISAPGTGISYTPSLASTTNHSKNNAGQLIAILIGGLGILCILIFSCIIIVLPDPDQNPTPTPASRSQEQPLLPIVPILPISTPAPNDKCSCTGDQYNCSDFQTRSAAQTCFDYCASQGFGDIHKLDQDNDNNVCETLP